MAFIGLALVVAAFLLIYAGIKGTDPRTELRAAFR